MHVNADRVHIADLSSYRDVIGRASVPEIKNFINNHHAKSVVKLTDDEGNTALHWAMEQGDLDVIKYLVKETTINVNAKNKQGLTALHLAASTAKTAYVLVLLASPLIYVTAIDQQEETALHKAVGGKPYEKDSIVKAREEIIRHLVEAGIDVNKVNLNNKKAYDIAKKQVYRQAIMAQ